MGTVHESGKALSPILDQFSPDRVSEDIGKLRRGGHAPGLLYR